MLVQANTPTNPDVGQVLDPQLINLSGTGHPLTGGIQPQRYQDLRVNGSCAWPTFQHLDMGIESRQVKIADRFPHQPWPSGLRVSSLPVWQVRAQHRCD